MRLYTGIPVPELSLMSYSLIERICKIKADDAREQAGQSGGQWSGGQWWNFDDNPEPENPDGPPSKNQFVAYARSVGASQQWAEAEFERQIANEGYGEVRGSDGNSF